MAGLRDRASQSGFVFKGVYGMNAKGLACVLSVAAMVMILSNLSFGYSSELNDDARLAQLQYVANPSGQVYLEQLFSFYSDGRTIQDEAVLLSSAVVEALSEQASVRIQLFSDALLARLLPNHVGYANPESSGFSGPLGTKDWSSFADRSNLLVGLILP
jgi:hypothetical protein